MAADGWYNYTGREGEVIPPGVTRVRIDESLTVIPARAFFGNRHIEELDCHYGVKVVEEDACFGCRSLRRVRMPGVKEVERDAFFGCPALTDVECGELEIIKSGAFGSCESLGSINLTSAKIVKRRAFDYCRALTNVKFGKELEKIEGLAFLGCTSLERITIPLKNGMITSDDIFQRCENLEQVDLVEGELLRDTIVTLQLEDWKTDMDRDMLSIDQILPNTSAGDDINDVGGKALAIRSWISSVLSKIIDYKAQHHSLLNEAATTLQQHALPQDIVMNNVLPFLELPSHTFEGEDTKRKMLQNDNARQDDNVANLSGMLEEGLLEDESVFNEERRRIVEQSCVIDEVEGLRASFQETTVASNNEIARLQDELRREQNEAFRLNQTCRAAIKYCRRHNANLERKNDEFISRNIQLGNDNRYLGGANEAMEAWIHNLEELDESSRATISELMSENAHLRQEIGRIIASSSAAIKSWMRQNGSLQRKNNATAMLEESLLENEEQSDAIMMLSAENQQLTDALATMSIIVDSVRCNSELRIRVSELERENARFVEQRDELEQEVARLVEAGEELTEENDHLGDEVAILEEENDILHEANVGLVEDNKELLKRLREIESSRVYQFVSSVCGAATRLTDLFRKRVNSNENNECDRPTKRVRLSDAC